MEYLSLNCAFPLVPPTGEAAVASRAGVPTRTYDNTQTYVVHDTNRRHAAEFVDSGNMTKLRHWQWFKPGAETIGEVTAAIENDYLRRSKQMTLAYYVGTDKNEREILTLPELPQIRLLRAIVGTQGAVLPGRIRRQPTYFAR